MITHRGISTEARVLWEFSLPSLAASVLVMPVNWACAAILVNQAGGYGEMGIFNVANQWRGFVMLVPNTLIGMSLPILANMVGENNEAGHHRVASTTILVNVGVTGVLAVVGLGSPHILQLYGAEYNSGGPVLWLCALSAIPAAYNHAASQVLASRNKVWVTVALTAGWAVGVFGLCVFFIQRWLALGFGRPTECLVTPSVRLSLDSTTVPGCANLADWFQN